ncbi:MAG: glycoside hydrolase family 38 [Phycisphaeraceae bacterium]|nr:glycoside hydrolase family 38 [Phycisphaeraceae bacterium]
MPKRRVHYVLSTHWDREWYQSFQDFRSRLVPLVDHILEGIADGRIAGPFQIDGQAIILEDYLEIRPERRAEIERRAQERRLVIGPWYVLPDEFLVSGESLVRNLRTGRAVARSFGVEPSDAGFACDLFGHNSQMPQIFAGFGIRGAFVWRGTNQADVRQMIWRGADGTEMPAQRFGRFGYGDFAYHVRQVEDRYKPFDAAETAGHLDAYLEREAAFATVDPILMFDGLDHLEWNAQVYGIVADRFGAEGGDFEIVHSSLDAFLDEMLAQIDRITERVEGELREPGLHPETRDHQWLIPGVLSSRVDIKQDNAACQTMLCAWAEPMGAMAGAALGREYPQGFLDVAWRYLLKNHPHDSICGCSIDEVHRDNAYRFRQCLQIAERQTTNATTALAASIEGDLADDTMRIVVFNPLTAPIERTAELTVPVPRDWPQFNEFFAFEPKPGFRVYDPHGNELAYQRLAQAMNRSKTRIRPTLPPELYQTDDVRISVPLRLPAMGYAALTIRRMEEGEVTRHPELPGLATSERSMANEHVAVTIASNGTLTLEDRRTGRRYERLLTFEDTADIGDGWYHGMAVNDQTFVSTGCPADVALVHDGPMLTTFRVRSRMALPVAFEFDGMTRSAQFVDLALDSRVSLRPGIDHVEVETTVDNVANDHRMRVLCPSGAASAATYLADSAFDVVERPIAVRADNHLYRELEVETRPQQSWTAVFDAEGGLAIIAPGLLETTVRDQSDRPIALTLFRATRRTIFRDGQPDGQMRGPMTFRYWIAPLAGAPDRKHLFDLAEQQASGLRAVPLRAADVDTHRHDRALPPTGSFLQVDGAVVVTSSRMEGDRLEVRMFNPTSDAAEATIRFPGQVAAAPRTATPVDFESRPTAPDVSLEDGRMSLTVEPKRIVTLQFA